MSQINCKQDSKIGVAFGSVDKSTLEDNEETLWGGLIYQGKLIEPQTPENYITYSGTKFSPRGIRVDNLSLKGKIIDKDTSLPVSGMKVQMNEKETYTNADGEYLFTDFPISENVSYSLSKDDYLTYVGEIDRANLRTSGDEYIADFEVESGFGIIEEEPEYVYIASTSSKTVETYTFAEIECSAARNIASGTYIKLNNLDGTFLDDSQYELYLDFTSKDKQLTNRFTWQFVFAGGKLIKILNNPKDEFPEQYVLDFVSCEVNEDEINLYIPNVLFKEYSQNSIGFMHGIWNEGVKDWSPSNRYGIESVAENPSTYIRLSRDGQIENGAKTAKEYDPSTDTCDYVDLGGFGGKTVRGITFSAPNAFIDNSDNDLLVVKFINNHVWQDDEKIELFIDNGDSSRICRDAHNWKMVISTDDGVVVDFINYGDEAKKLPRELIEVYMNENEMKIEIPHSCLAGFDNETLVGFSFGVFNMSANDWDGYGFDDTYIDPELPYLYVRVNKDNEIVRQ